MTNSSFISTAVVGLLLLLVIALVIRSMWRKKKAGGSCSCGCSGCSQSCNAKRPDEGK